MRRRFQHGCLTQRAGSWYVMYYIDADDGGTKQVCKCIGRLDQMSERAARRELSRIMEGVNHARGSAAPVYKGQTFEDAVNKWREAIAPNLSPATVRPYESALKVHILPRFARMALHEMGVHQLQQFATELRKSVSGKTTVNILSSIFAVLKYAEKCGAKTAKVEFGDIEFGSWQTEEAPFFTREQAMDIINTAAEPFKTLFAVAWSTGMRAGEILALTIGDLDFKHKTICVNKSADDRTREIRQPKTPKSIGLLPMNTHLEAMLRAYIQGHWRPNPKQILFPNRKGTRPRQRDNVVKVGLKPVLRKLGISTANVGLHAFRHGLATELADRSVPVNVLQQQMRHADVKTTLKVYAHVIPQTQRDVMENVGNFQSLVNNQSLVKFAVKK